MRILRQALVLVRATALALLGAVLLLAGAELLLYTSGYGWPTARFVLDDSGSIYDNPAFARRFFPGPWLPDTAPVRVSSSPMSNTLRVAVLGESAAYGYPDPAFGMARMLEVLLAGGRPVEVINAAQSGVSSPVLREVLRDVLKLQPDVVVLYMGNNEFIGPFGAGNPAMATLPSPELVRAQVLASRLRLTQWVKNLVPSPVAVGDASPMACRPIPPGDLAIAETHERFEANLHAMIDDAASTGVQVVLCTLPVNARDWAPFGSAHRENLGSADLEVWNAAWEEGLARWGEEDAAAALAAWQRAAELDPTPARLQFMLGRALKSTGEAEAADEAFQRALINDTLPYRVTPVMNARIRQVASGEGRRVKLVDCDVLFKDSAAELFYDHCHLTPAGNYAVASAVLQAITVSPINIATAPPLLPLSDAESRLGWNPWHERENIKYVRYLADREPYPGRMEHEAWLARMDEEIKALDSRLAGGELAKARSDLALVIEAHPFDLWLHRNGAQLDMALGELGTAASHWEDLTKIYPNFIPAWPLLARAHADNKAPALAAEAWRKACALRPDRRDWRLALAGALFDAADYGSARIEYRALAEARPTDADAWWKVGQTHEREEDFVAAIAAYRKGLGHAPEHAGLHYYLAKALLHEGQRDEARAIVGQGLKFGPDNKGLQSLMESLNEVP